MHGQTLLTATVSAALLSLIPGGISTTHASITLDLMPIDNSALLSGYHTYDLNVTTDTDWTAAAGLLELTAGSIYQHAQGEDHLVPHAFQLAQSPSLAFDTYVNGSVAGGAGDVGGTGYAFNESRLEATWYNTTQADIGTITIGRLTLTDDAAGSLSMYLTSADDRAEYDVTFSPGVAPLMSQIIEEDEPDPWEWESPTIINASDAWPSSPLGYGYNHYLMNSNPYVVPTLDDPRRYVLNDTFRYIDYGNAPVARPERVLPIDGRRTWNSFYVMEPEFEVLPPPDAPSLLPEPGALMLTGLGFGLAVLRGRRA